MRRFLDLDSKDIINRVSEDAASSRLKAAITASPIAMTQHSDASSDRSEASVTPPPAEPKMIDFNQPNLSFFNIEHRNMLTAPLAALHSMTEMKQHQTHHRAQEKNETDVLLERTSLHVERSGLTSRSPLGATSNSNSSQGANPHGIDHILSRPSQITTGPLHFPHNLGFPQNTLGMASNSAQTASNPSFRRFNFAAALFHHHANTMNKPPVELGAGGIYWPTLPGLGPFTQRDRSCTRKFHFLSFISSKFYPSQTRRSLCHF